MGKKDVEEVEVQEEEEDFENPHMQRRLYNTQSVARALAKMILMEEDPEILASYVLNCCDVEEVEVNPEFQNCLTVAGCEDELSFMEPWISSIEIT